MIIKLWWDYILDNTLTRAGVPFTKAESGDDLTVTIDPGYLLRGYAHANGRCCKSAFRSRIVF